MVAGFGGRGFQCGPVQWSGIPAGFLGRPCSGQRSRSLIEDAGGGELRAAVPSGPPTANARLLGQGHWVSINWECIGHIVQQQCMFCFIWRVFIRVPTELAFLHV